MKSYSFSLSQSLFLRPFSRKCVVILWTSADVRRVWVSIRGIWNNQVSRMVHILSVCEWQCQDCGKLNLKNTQLCVHCALRWSWAVMAVRCWTAAAWMVLSICNCNTTGIHWRSSCGGGACHSLFLLGAADSRRSLATLQVGSGGCVPTSSLKVSWRGCCFSGGLPHSLLSTGAAGPWRSLASPANLRRLPCVSCSWVGSMGTSPTGSLAG